MDSASIALTQDDLLQLTTAQLTQLYHHAQLAAVVCIVDLDFYGACYWLELTLAARIIVYDRFGKVDAGHAGIYNELFEELKNVERQLSLPFQCPYFFKSGILVGNAIDNKIYVPQNMYPIQWHYSDYCAQQYVRAAKKQRYVNRRAGIM